MQSLQPQQCFLPQNSIPARTAFTEGNAVNAFIDGADYMADLAAALGNTVRNVCLAGWRVTGQQYLRPTPPQLTVVDGLLGVLAQGGRVRAMLYQVEGVAWPGPLRVWHGADNRLFCDALRAAGQEAILDGRVSARYMSSHHQKYVIVETEVANASAAYVGGIDLCFDRWDTSAHASPPERQRDIIEFYMTHAAMFGALLALPAEVPQYISSYQPSMPGWHDVQARLKGPAVRQIWDTFANRWNDPRPANNKPGLENFRTVQPLTMPPAAPTASAGTCWVQILQTLPCHAGYPSAPNGEQTVLAGYARAIDMAEHYIYIEDQYLWPSDLVARLDAALRRNVHVVMVVARDFDLPGMSAIHCGMRGRVINQLRAANPSHFKVFHLQQPSGQQIYVHAKTMIVDDAIAFIGSANLNHRSMSNDSELQVAVLDAKTLPVPMAGQFKPGCWFAHEYRRRLWAEHLRVPDAAVVDPILAITTLWANAAGGRVQHHNVQTPGLDVTYIAKFLTTLLMSGLPFNALPIVLPPPVLGAPAVQSAIEAVLASTPAAIIQWLEDFLNPRLTC